MSNFLNGGINVRGHQTDVLFNADNWKQNFLVTSKDYHLVIKIDVKVKIKLAHFLWKNIYVTRHNIIVICYTIPLNIFYYIFCYNLFLSMFQKYFWSKWTYISS